VSRQTDILAALQARLEGIAKADGYQTDAGAAVFSWLSYRLAPATFPMLVWRDAERTVSTADDFSPSLGEESHILAIDIEGMIRCSDDIAELRALIEDVRKAVAVDIYWGGLADTTENWQDSKTVEDTEEGLLGFCRITFEIIYNLGNWED